MKVPNTSFFFFPGNQILLFCHWCLKVTYKVSFRPANSHYTLHLNAIVQLHTFGAQHRAPRSEPTCFTICEIPVASNDHHSVQLPGILTQYKHTQRFIFSPARVIRWTLECRQQHASRHTHSKANWPWGPEEVASSPCSWATVSVLWFDPWIHTAIGSCPLFPCWIREEQEKTLYWSHFSQILLPL